MDLLKELTLRGKMIFVVIHQPSSDIYKMFDSMIILDVGGFQIYYGNPLEAVVYFKTRVNMVNKEQSACIECGNVNAEQVFTIIENKVVNEFGRFTDQRKISPNQWNEHFTNAISLPQPKKDSVEPLKSELNLPNKINQVKIFMKRDILSKWGNRQYLLKQIFYELGTRFSRKGARCLKDLEQRMFQKVLGKDVHSLPRKYLTSNLELFDTT